MAMHWSYYEDEFDWDDSSSMLIPDPKSAERLEAAGFSHSEARRMVSSGFVLLPESDVVIDRYYGGALLSVDLRTRFFLSSFRNDVQQSHLRSRAWVRSVESLTQLHQLIDQLKTESKYNILFRGQNANFPLERAVANPCFDIRGMGEVSLVPSVWRRMIKRKPERFTNFMNITLFEWSLIFDHLWDIDKIKKIHKEKADTGELILTFSDMEDCDDELLSRFGRFKSRLNYDFEQISPMLSTLLQHYGLYSPMLDLTSDPDVAVYFATHTFEGSGAESRYHFSGTNNRKAVIYILRENQDEMLRHQRDYLLTMLDPQRPKRQACVVSGSGPWAVNLPADFLVGVIRLDFDLHNPDGFSTEHLFPASVEDKFLEALVAKKIQRVTSFS